MTKPKFNWVVVCGCVFAIVATIAVDSSHLYGNAKVVAIVTDIVLVLLCVLLFVDIWRYLDEVAKVRFELYRCSVAKDADEREADLQELAESAESVEKELDDLDDELEQHDKDRVFAMQTIAWFQEHRLSKVDRSVRDEVGEAFGEVWFRLFRAEDGGTEITTSRGRPETAFESLVETAEQFCALVEADALDDPARVTPVHQLAIGSLIMAQSGRPNDLSDE